MLFGGMQKLTTLDFPGVVSALLFTQGCNFHCPYCHNTQLISAAPSQTALPENEVLSFLAKRAGLLDGVAITGGEPCLQGDLESFCRKVKKLGYKIKLDTNGSFPETIARLIAGGLLDYLALDVKTGPENYAPLLAGENAEGKGVAEKAADGKKPDTKKTNEKSPGEKLGETLKILAASPLPFEVRTTCAAPFVNETAVLEMAKLVPSHVPWLFQRANIEKPSATMYALPDDAITPLLGLLAKTHPLARLRD